MRTKGHLQHKPGYRNSHLAAAYGSAQALTTLATELSTDFTISRPEVLIDAEAGIGPHIERRRVKFISSVGAGYAFDFLTRLGVRHPQIRKNN